MSDRQIHRVLSDGFDADSSELADRLLAEIAKLDDPHQDNVCFTVIKVLSLGAGEARQGTPKLNGKAGGQQRAKLAPVAEAQPSKSPSAGLFAFLRGLLSSSSGVLR